MTENSLMVWRNIDPVEAETRLAVIRRRDAELDEAFKNQIVMQRHHPNSFAVSLATKSLEARRDIIASEIKDLLRYRVNEPVRLSLDGSSFHDHSAGIGTLAIFLIRFQKLYSAVAQAIQTGPTLRGPIALALREATELRLAELYPSSFGMELYVPTQLDIMGRSVSADSLYKMFELLQSSDDDKKLMEMSGTLGGRVVSHLRSLASQLSNSETIINLSWNDYTGNTNLWSSSSDNSRKIVANLKEIIHVSSSKKTYVGVLGGGSLFRHSFELRRSDDGALIEGSMLPVLLDDMKENFGKSCVVDVDETEVTDKASGEKKTYYILTGIKSE